MTNNQQEMIEYTAQEITSYLMDDNGIDMASAMDTLFGSELFKKLQDVETGLYLEGSAYVYELLKKELADSSANAQTAAKPDQISGRVLKKGLAESRKSPKQ